MSGQTVYVILVRLPRSPDFTFVGGVFGSREDATTWMQSHNMAQVDPPIDEDSDEVWQMQGGMQFKILPERLRSYPE